MSPDELIELMKELGGVPEIIAAEIHTLPREEVSRRLVEILEQFEQAVNESIERVDQYLLSLDAHLLAKHHEPDSDCWAARAEALQVKCDLLSRLDSIEKLWHAARQFSNPDEVN